jgi:hypothetical protein
MNILIHNPSNLNITTSTIAVPAGNYEAKYFDMEKRKYREINTTLLCTKDLGYKVNFNDSKTSNRPKELIKNC